MKKAMKLFLILIMCAAMLVIAGCKEQNVSAEEDPTDNISMDDNGGDDNWGDDDWSDDDWSDDDQGNDDQGNDDQGNDDQSNDDQGDDDQSGDDLGDDNLGDDDWGTENDWSVVSNLKEVKGMINQNGGTVNRDNEADGVVTFTFKDGNPDNQLICQFAEAAEGVTAFEISTTVQPGATARRGVGFKTPDGFLFFNVVNNGGENGVGYVVFDVFTDGMKKDQAYQTLDADAEAIIVGDEAYTLRLVVTDINDAGTGTFEFYVNDILVYTMDNTFTNAEGNPWNLSTKVLAAIGVRGINADATFSKYTFKAN